MTIALKYSGDENITETRTAEATTTKTTTTTTSATKSMEGRCLILVDIFESGEQIYSMLLNNEPFS